MDSKESKADFSDGDTLSKLYYIFVPMSMVLTFTSFLIFIGMSFGIRRAYVYILLKIFEYITSTTKPSKRTETSGDCPDDRLIEHDNRLTEQSLVEFYENIKPEVGGNKTLLASLGAIYYVKAGVEAIVEDEVTQRFSAENLQTWNLLTRTNVYQHINMKMTILWGFGFCLRYFVLLPFRLSLSLSAICGVSLATSFLILIPNKRIRQELNAKFLMFFFRLFMRSFSSVLNFHNPENRAKSDGICVANHTSPIDAIVLSTDNSYAMVGQSQGGFMGLMQSVFGSAESHVWFDRSVAHDRLEVARRLQEHVADPEKLPILIFPEGTCINNTSVMMFKKGSFEVGGVIYPAAIKYDSRFSDCFWNSSKNGFVGHLMRIMTSWAVVADIWYLPPMKRNDGETGIQFANRVKKAIARQGGLVDMEWDGNLKRNAPNPNLKLKQRRIFYEKIRAEEEEDSDNSNIVRNRNPQDLKNTTDETPCKMSDTDVTKEVMIDSSMMKRESEMVEAK